MFTSFLIFEGLLKNSLADSSTISFNSIFSISSFNELLSILATSNISCVSLYNLSEFLFIGVRKSSFFQEMPLTFHNIQL